MVIFVYFEKMSYVCFVFVVAKKKRLWCPPHFGISVDVVRNRPLYCFSEDVLIQWFLALLPSWQAALAEISLSPLLKFGTLLMQSGGGNPYYNENRSLPSSHLSMCGCFSVRHILAFFYYAQLWSINISLFNV